VPRVGVGEGLHRLLIRSAQIEPRRNLVETIEVDVQLAHQAFTFTSVESDESAGVSETSSSLVVNALT